MEILFFLYNQGCYILSTEYENYSLAEIQGAVILLRRTKLWLRGKTDGERLMYVCSCVATKAARDWLCVRVCVILCAYKTLLRCISKQTSKKWEVRSLKERKQAPCTVHPNKQARSKRELGSLQERKQAPRSHSQGSGAAWGQNHPPHRLHCPVPESWNVTVSTAGSNCRAFRQPD